MRFGDCLCVLRGRSVRMDGDRVADGCPVNCFWYWPEKIFRWWLRKRTEKVEKWLLVTLLYNSIVVAMVVFKPKEEKLWIQQSCCIWIAFKWFSFFHIVLAFLGKKEAQVFVCLYRKATSHYSPMTYLCRVAGWG